MKKYLLIILMFFLSGYLFAQTIVKGKITDSKSNHSIEGVNVFLSEQYFTTTNSKGEFVVRNLPADKYSIKISHISYKTKEILLELKNDTTFLNTSLEPSNVNLDEVIITSSKHEQYIKNLPYSALLIDNLQIQRTTFFSVPDILKTEPGINLIRDGIWATDISIRGMNRSNIVTLIDGNRLETSNDLAARLSLIDVNDIDRIEIIKGASSTLYGSGATGGVVNVITKSSSFEDRLFLTGNFSGGYNSVNNSSEMSGMLSGGSSFWSSKISASTRNADDINTPVGKLRNSKFKDYSISGLLNISPFSNHLLKVNYQLVNAKDVGVPGGYPLFPDNADVRYPKEKRELFSTSYEIRNLFPSLNKLSLKYSHQYIMRDVENIPHIVQNVPAQGTQPARRVSVLKITPGADHFTNTLQLQTDFILVKNNYLIAGIDYWERQYRGEREKYQTIEILSQDGSSVVKTIEKIISEKPLPNSDYKSFGFFIQDEMQLFPDKLKLTLGARIDRININGKRTLNPQYEITDGVINYSPAGQKVIWEEAESKNNSYSGNLGLLLTLNPNLDFTFTAGHSFRSPSLEERFQFIDLGSLVRLGNPDLKSEEGNFFDLGIRLRTENIKFSVSTFVNYLNDLVVEEPGTYESRPAAIKTNIGKARLYGFEVSSDFNFYKDMVAYTNVSYVRGEDTRENEDLPQIPPLNGLAGLRFPVFEFINADISSIIYSKQNTIASGEIETPGYAYFNISLGTKPIKVGLAKLQFYSGVDNLFDKNYRNHLSTNRGLITVEPGRNVYIKTIINW